MAKKIVPQEVDLLAEAGLDGEEEDGSQAEVGGPEGVAGDPGAGHGSVDLVDETGEESPDADRP